MSVAKGNCLESGAWLPIGACLESENKQYRLVLRDNGCLVLECMGYGANQLLWDSGTIAPDTQGLYLMPEGNLALLRDQAKPPVWATAACDATGRKGHYAVVQNDGDFVLYTQDHTVVWRTGTFGQVGNSLMYLEDGAGYEQVLGVGRHLLSANKRYQLLLHKSGLLELNDLEREEPLLHLAPHSGAIELRMQQDGNLVLYRKVREGVAWATNTHTSGPGARLVVENYGVINVFAKSGELAWTCTSFDKADWMRGLDDALPLKEVCLPGSHLAGMYQAKKMEGRETLPVPAAVAAYYAESAALAQKLTLFQQLKEGIRYFDLRLTLYQGELRMYHGAAHGPTLAEMLKDVHSFMQRYSQQIIVLNFSHFDFPEAYGEDFLEQINEYLSPYLFDIAVYHRTQPMYEPPTRLFELPISALRRKVLILIEGNYALYNQAVVATEQKGVYFRGHPSYIRTDSYYAVAICEAPTSQLSYGQMCADRQNAFRDFKDETRLFSVNWTLAPQTDRLLAEINEYLNRAGTPATDIPDHDIVALKNIVDKYSLRTLAQQVSPLLFGGRKDNDFVFVRNAQGERVNIMQVDFVDTANLTRACLRLLSS